MKNLKALLLCFLLVTMFIGCGKKKKIEKDEKKEIKKLSTVVFNLERDPKTLDPQLLKNHASIELAGSIWEGLTRIGKNGEVIPGVAKDWKVDGKKWTFTLRDNAKWSDGTAVLAQDFYLAIKRAMSPETMAKYAYMTYYIKNAEAFNKNKIKDFSNVGVKVIDDRTLEIELETPTVYFASILAFPTYFPVPSKIYENIKENYGLKAEKMLFNGPWIVESWSDNSKIIVKKNPNYWNKKAIKIDILKYVMVANTSTAGIMYRNKEIDITKINEDQLLEFKTKEDLVSFNDGSVWYLEFNTKHRVFKNKKIRKAIALAIDRKTLVEKIRKDGSSPARSFVPFGFPGKDKTFREDFGAELFKDDDIKIAKKLLSEGLKEIRHYGKIKFTLLCGSEDRAVKEAQYYRKELSEKLEIDVLLEPVKFQTRLKKMKNKDFDVVSTGWKYDYGDPMTYMDLWISEGENNYTSWATKYYDDLIGEAYGSSDKKARMEAMAEAEKFLLEEFPIIPMFFRNKNYLIKPNIKGVVKRAIGQQIDFYWASVDETVLINPNNKKILEKKY